MRNWSNGGENRSKTRIYSLGAKRILKVTYLDNRGVGERWERGGEIEITHKIKPKKGGRKYHKDDCLFAEFLLQTYFTWCSFL